MSGPFSSTRSLAAVTRLRAPLVSIGTRCRFAAAFPAAAGLWMDG